MFYKTEISLFFASIIIIVHFCFSDVIVTLDGEELYGKIVAVSDDVVKYIPQESSDSSVHEVPKQSVFMLKYDDGRKEVFNAKKGADPQSGGTGDHPYSAQLFCEIGLFGLVNINEDSFDPGVFTIGVTPSIDRRLNRFLSIGVEYMVLWAQANDTKDARFLMNCNAMVRVSFPLSQRLQFLSQAGAGLSIWPEAESVHNTDTTFFKQRLGWDIHGGLGLEFNVYKKASVVLYAGYNGNFTTVDKIPITIDMFIVSIGPKIRF